MSCLYALSHPPAAQAVTQLAAIGVGRAVPVQSNACATLLERRSVPALPDMPHRSTPEGPICAKPSQPAALSLSLITKPLGPR